MPHTRTQNHVVGEAGMGVRVEGWENIPLLPLNIADLKALADVLDGYLAYLRLAHLLAQGDGAFFISGEELKALKEAARGLLTLMTCIIPSSRERDLVIESLQGLYEQFALMLSPLVN